MPDPILVVGYPVEGHAGQPLPPPGRPTDPGYGQGHPIPPIAKPPIVIPPAPPVINPPPSGLPPWGAQLPVEPDWPIVIPQPPDKPEPGPPDTIYPPPDLPGPTRGWLLVYIVGSGGKKLHWIWVDWTKPVEPPPAQPKR